MNTTNRTRLVAAVLAAIALFCLLLTSAPSQAEAKTFILGDSRICWMYYTFYGFFCDDLCEIEEDGEEIWKANAGIGCDWLDRFAVPYVNKHVDTGDDIVVCLGVNDPYNAENYARLLNKKAADWKNIGATTFFVSVNPVDDPIAALHGFTHRNAGGYELNAKIQPLLDPDYVTYIDTCSAIEDHYKTADGLHFDEDTNKEIYNLIYTAIGEAHNGQVPKHGSIDSGHRIEKVGSSIMASSADGEPEAKQQPDIAIIGIALGIGVLLGIGSTSAGVFIASKRHRRDEEYDEEEYEYDSGY